MYVCNYKHFRSQKAIFQNMYTEIPKMFPFVISESNLEVISGKQEGVYAWIAVNYVLHKFDHGADGKECLIPTCILRAKCPYIYKQMLHIHSLKYEHVCSINAIVSTYNTLPISFIHFHHCMCVSCSPQKILRKCSIDVILIFLIECLYVGNYPAAITLSSIILIFLGDSKYQNVN